MRLRTIGLVAALCVAPATGRAEVYYESVHVTEGGPQGVREFRARGWAEADRARVEFVDAAADGLLCGGCYVLTEDAGATLWFVDPSKETYSRWELAAMLGMLGSVMESGLISVELSTPISEEILREPGDSIVGYETTHVRWRTAYEMLVKMMGFKQRSTIEVVQDLWTAESLSVPGLSVWLRSEPPRTGDESFDAIIAGEMAKVHGVPLRSKTVTTRVDKKGRPTVTTDTMEVTRLEAREASGDLFRLPDHFDEVPLVPEMAGAAGQGESPMQGLRGLLGRKEKN